jgi:hypothetical protein
MNKETWKTLYRNQRISARKGGAQAYRVFRKLLCKLSGERYMERLAFLSQVHDEIAPKLTALRRSHDALDALSLV